MSGTIAQLGLAVNSSEAVQAATDLDKLAQAGVKAEKAAEGVAAGFEKASVAASELSGAGKKLAETTEEAKARLLAMAKASLESNDYYQKLTTSVNSNSVAINASGSSVSSLSALSRRLKADSDALVGTVDQQAEATKKAAAATGVQAEGLQALLAKINPTVAAYERLDNQQELLKRHLKAGNIDSDQFKTYSADIEKTRSKLGDFDDGLSKTGISAKQTEQALRQLPAQFTDIFTSLAGGQNPLMVLIQQGGQIKDSFGGIGPTMDVLKDKFRLLFSGGAGAAVLGESLAGIASGAKDTAESAGEASESLSGLAESSNTAAEAAENAKKAYGALPPAVTGASMSIMGMVAAVAAVAAVVGTLIYGYNKGSQEADEYNKALILTGNAAGTSADQLADLAQQVAATNGTTGDAAASLAKLAGSGVIAGESFGAIAEAAAAMEDATGKSVDATIAEFVKIAKDPVAAAKELNDQYHFLTASVYSQIVALKEQGDTIGAAKLLTDTYADTVKTRSTEITDNLGTIEKAWKGIKDAAAGALDATLNIGRKQSFAQQVVQAEGLLEHLRTKGGSVNIPGENNTYFGAQGIADLEVYIAALKEKGAAEAKASKEGGERRKIQDDAVNAQVKVDALTRSSLTNEQKRTEAVKEYRKQLEDIRKGNPSDARLNQGVIDKNIANINARFKDQKTAKGSAGAVDLTAFNAAQNALKEIQADYANTQKQLDAVQKAGLISQEEYSWKRAGLIGNEKDEVTSAYEAEIFALEAAKAKKSTTGEQQIQLDQKIADARTNMVKAQKDADSQLEVLATSETGRLAKQERAITSYIQALGQQQKALELAGQRAVLGVGQGDRQNALHGELNSQQDRFAQQSLALDDQKSDPSRNMSDEEFARKSQALADANKKATDQIRQNYADVEAAQGDWTKGATSAWANYLDSAQNVAGQTKSLFSNAFSSMEDAVVNFAMTGKLSFADFTKSILADMARIATRQAASGILSSLVGLGVTAAGSYFGGGATSAGSTAAGYSPEALAGWSGVTQAKGGAWSGGVQMFADGGAFTNSVVSKPTAFGMANGKTGVMGEAGDEAIMPLTRTANGKLGVMSVGGAGGGTSVSLSMPIMVMTDEESGRPDGAELDTEAFQRNMQERMRAVAKEEIAKSWRQGGVSSRNVKG